MQIGGFAYMQSEIAFLLRILLSSVFFFLLFNFQDEAFALWEHQWGRIYPEKSTAREIIHTIHDTYYLINLVDNDYVAGNKLFDILDIVLKKLGKL